MPVFFILRSHFSLFLSFLISKRIYIYIYIYEKLEKKDASQIQQKYTGRFDCGYDLIRFILRKEKKKNVQK